MHLTDGEIKAYQDCELSPHEKERIQAHLDVCPNCQERYEHISTKSEIVTTQVKMLNPSSLSGSRSIQKARILMEKHILEKEKISMFKKIFTTQYRLVWIILAVVAILALAFAFPDVRAAANDFLGLFRVQQFTVVQFDPEDLQNNLGSSSHFEYALSEDVHIEEMGEPQEVSDANEASALVGIPVRLPTDVEGDQQLMVFPGAKVTFDIDLARVNMILNEIGQGGIELDPELDGSQVSMELPGVVMATFGDCTIDYETTKAIGADPDAPEAQLTECTLLHQMTNPTINAPPELDVAQIGESFLQLIGMSPEEAALFSETVDWTTTLIIPIPRYSTTYEEVFVDGVEGTLILQKDYVPKYMLLWIKNDIVYALSGPGNRSTALTIAASLK